MTKRIATVCAPVLCALVAAAPAAAAPPKALPALTPVQHDALSRALAHGKLSEAEYALERARSLFALGEVRREFGEVARPDPHAATPILRDLAARLSFLSPADRVSARGILSRPTNNRFVDEHHYTVAPGQVQGACDPEGRPLCYHWVTTTRDAASPANVAATMNAFAGVYDLEVGTYAYRSPLPDDTSQGEAGEPETDIYLADLGGDRVPFFGYCTTDDPNAFDTSYPFSDVSAYCVVDEDFTNSAFGGIDPNDARAVTAAHEFFHAIQFGYDWFEDWWLMEGTAMLMEDQFADDVNDNVNYLDKSALREPWISVDRGSDGFQYGAWIWWRFLVEEFGELGDPVVIRKVWEEAADASTDTDGAGPDTVASHLYSLQAAGDVLRRRSRAIDALFAKFARVNRNPAAFYDEGELYPVPPSSARYGLGAGRRATGWRSTRLNHLSSRYYTFTPRSDTPRRADLRVRVDLPKLARRPAASLLVRFADGRSRTRSIALDADGNGTRLVSFGRREVKRVVLVLTNASFRMICDRGTFNSCAGVGRDDRGLYQFAAKIR